MINEYGTIMVLCSVKLMNVQKALSQEEYKRTYY